MVGSDVVETAEATDAVGHFDPPRRVLHRIPCLGLVRAGDRDVDVFRQLGQKGEDVEQAACLRQIECRIVAGNV